MITNFLIQFVLSVATGLFSLLPDMTWDVASDSFSGFLDVIASVCYLLPMHTISTIIGLIVYFAIFRAVVSLVVTIWDLLPIV